MLARSRMGLNVIPQEMTPNSICTACNGGHAIDARLRHGLRCNQHLLRELHNGDAIRDLLVLRYSSEAWTKYPSSYPTMIFPDGASSLTTNA